jgi:hypothetical protein
LCQQIQDSSRFLGILQAYSGPPYFRFYIKESFIFLQGTAFESFSARSSSVLVLGPFFSTLFLWAMHGLLPLKFSNPVFLGAIDRWFYRTLFLKIQEKESFYFSGLWWGFLYFPPICGEFSSMVTCLPQRT